MYYQNVYKYDDMKRSEHMAVRKDVGWYLFTHYLVEVTGEDGAAFLDSILTSDIAGLKPGKDRFALMLADDGTIIDDMIIMHVQPGIYWVSTLYRIDFMKWAGAHMGEFKVTLTDISRQWQMYAVQGPKSRELLAHFLKEPIDGLEFFSVQDNEMNGFPVKVNRAGFTGEKYGYELYVPADKADEVEALLRTNGKALGATEVTEFQIMAWTLPTEAGFYLLQDMKHANPLELGLEKVVDWDKAFIGKSALLAVKAAGPVREMLGFTVAEADVHINAKDLGGPGYPIYKDDEEVGRVSKFNYSFVKDLNIGYMLVKKGVFSPGDKVLIHGYEATVCDKHFL